MRFLADFTNESFDFWLEVLFECASGSKITHANRANVGGLFPTHLVLQLLHTVDLIDVFHQRFLRVEHIQTFSEAATTLFVLVNGFARGLLVRKRFVIFAAHMEFGEIYVRCLVGAKLVLATKYKVHFCIFDVQIVLVLVAEDLVTILTKIVTCIKLGISFRFRTFRMMNFFVMLLQFIILRKLMIALTTHQSFNWKLVKNLPDFIQSRHRLVMNHRRFQVPFHDGFFPAIILAQFARENLRKSPDVHVLFEQNRSPERFVTVRAEEIARNFVQLVDYLAVFQQLFLVFEVLIAATARHSRVVNHVKITVICLFNNHGFWWEKVTTSFPPNRLFSSNSFRLIN